MRKMVLSGLIVLSLMLTGSGLSLAADSAVVVACKEYIASIDSSYDTISPTAVYKNLGNVVVVDCRTEQEYKVSHIEGAINIPLREVMERLDELDKDYSIVVHCKSGIRSSYFVTMLKMNGYTNVKNMLGGFNGWIAANLPVVK